MKQSKSSQIKDLHHEVDTLRQLREIDKREIKTLRDEVSRLQKVNKQGVINSLANIIDANAQLTQFAARVIEPGTF